MKHWPSQLFPIILLAVLAGLSFWLQTTVEPEAPQPSGKLRHDPDAYAENFTLRRFDANGHLKYRLSAPYLVHYPDDDSSEVTSPTLISFRPGAPSVTVTSDHAKVSAKGETVYLWDKVSLFRAATADRPELLARMHDLTALPDKGFAFTKSPVVITQGKSWLQGIGAEIDNNKFTFVLQSHVTGLYIRTRAKQ